MLSRHKIKKEKVKSTQLPKKGEREKKKTTEKYKSYAPYLLVSTSWLVGSVVKGTDF